MKRTHYLWIIVVLFSLLTGCAGENCIANNRHYSLEKDGDNYYLVLKTNHVSSSAEGAVEAAPTVTFSSVAEMKNDILTGDFTDEELLQIGRFSQNDAQKTIVCDLGRLYEPTLPEGIDISYVSWYGKSYSFHIYDNTAFSQLHISNRTKEYFDEKIAEYNDNGGHDVEQSEDDRNAIEYSYRAASGLDVKIVKYTIPCSDKIVYVVETYHCTELHTPFAKETLVLVDLYIESDGRYTVVTVVHPEERPSVEWLSQFGMKEYVETKVS